MSTKAQDKNSNKGGRAVGVVSTKIDRERVLTQVGEARSAFQSATLSLRSARILAARATYAVESAGMVGKGKVWDKWTDYAQDDKQGLGMSPHAATALRRQGKALALGLDPENVKNKDAARWSFLSDKGGTAAVGAVFTKDLKTLTALRKGLDAAMAGAGKGTGSGSTKGKGKGKRDKQTPTLPGKGKNAALFETIETCLTRVDWAKVTPENVAALVSRIESFASESVASESVAV
jgi:hypothetical protein